VSARRKNGGGSRAARAGAPALVALLFFAALAVAAVLAVRHLTEPGTLPLRTIRVEGRFRHLERAALRRALAGAVDGGFFSVDLEKVRHAALRLPWVAAVAVRRVWPDRLEVKVTEQVPVARWNERGLVNEAGEVFYPAKGGWRGPRLRFRGPEGKAGRVLDFYRRVREGFRGRGLEIRQVALDPRGEWRLRLADGLLVVVGREQWRYRIDRLLDVYPLLGRAARKPRRIDLRYEQGFAVAWRSQEKG